MKKYKQRREFISKALGAIGATGLAEKIADEKGVSFIDETNMPDDMSIPIALLCPPLYSLYGKKVDYKQPGETRLCSTCGDEVRASKKGLDATEGRTVVFICLFCANRAATE